MLKTTNYRQMSDEIPMQQLPVLFQNVIDVCRQLGIEYLWIDSLCILQDSPADWSIESAKMCEYYGNSILTISTSLSPSSDVPIFAERDRRWWPQSFQVDLDDGSKAELHAREHLQSTAEFCADGGGRLATRAWVWQENVLCRRLVRYTRSGLIWDCKSIDRVQLDDGELPWSLSQWGKRETSLQQVATVNPLRTWYLMVQSYTQRELTYVTDRLPAISGVAAWLHQYTKCGYFAGHWESNLTRSLCWIRSMSGELFNCGQYIAPSWAWPSIGKHIRYGSLLNDSEWTDLATIRAVSCSTKSGNKFGQVTDGHLLLRGRLGSVQVFCKDPHNLEAYRLPKKSATRSAQYVMPDCALVAANGRLRRALKGNELVSFDLEVPCVLLEKVTEEKYPDRYFALLLEQVHDSSSESHGDSSHAPSGTNDVDHVRSRAVYRRIGILRLAADEVFSEYSTTIKMI